jgi:manganese-dependent inorganic pyrophosphatase
VSHRVTSYRNPDLDGVASAIVRAYYLQATARVDVTAVFAGELDAETRFVLGELELPLPMQVEVCPVGDSVHLVDTHHLSQVQGHVDPAMVLSAVDHHPAGTPEAFPRATIINEKVGAVATIIAEMVQAKGLDIVPAHSKLLQAAIISNTLNFAAPTTTARDRDSAAWLEANAPLPQGFGARLLATRATWNEKTTGELLASDYKEWQIGGTVIGISQLEIPGAELLMARDDLAAALDRFTLSTSADHVLLSVVDIDIQHTWILVRSDTTRRLVAEAVGVTFDGDRAHVERILLRKSDFVPGLRRCLDDSRAL